MNQIKDNPFPYSSDNKRYQTFSWYLKNRYHAKCAKIPLNAGFTCPNRDGTKAYGGCSFCSAMGSGDTILAFDASLMEQYQANLARARQKWPQAIGMPYFQSYTNTYAPLPVLQQIYTPFLEMEDTAALCIATRPDCLCETFLSWISGFDKEVWIELGLQTIHEKTGRLLNRQHSTLELVEAVLLCRKYGIKTCVHLMNGLPGEDRQMMVDSARLVGVLHPDAVKIHMLHLLENTRLAAAYRLEPFELLSMDEYVSIVCDQLEVLPADIIIERVTGDGLAEDLIAPMWTTKKTMTANNIDKELLRRNSWQSKYADVL